MIRVDPPSGLPMAGSRTVFLGRLEALVMDCLWRSETAMSVRDVALRLNGPWAYTTLMTTLDRLFKKDLASREPRGRAYLYRARLSRTDLGVQALKTAVSDIDAGADTRGLALAALVDALESHDPDLLDSLDRLVREKRRALRQARKAEERG
jgi:predicted transcriptional regulator